MLAMRSLTDRLAAIHPPARGAAWMLLAAALFAVMITLIRHLTDSLHPFQVAFLRNLFGLLFLLPWLASVGIGALRTQRLRLHFLRAGTGVVGMLCWFSALAMMPLGEAVALSFTSPLFASVLAAMVLREAAGPRRWLAICVGFLGALVILRPGVAAFTPAALLVLASACIFAISVVLVKLLLRTDSPNAAVMYMTLFLTPISLPMAALVWQWPDWQTLGIAAALGAVASSAHLCFARALKLADASAVMPLDFARLPLTALIAYFAFGERVDLWIWVGAGIIAASAVYITRHEARAARPAPAGTS